MPPHRRAVWSDLWQVPPGLKAEILDGTIETVPSAGFEHQELVSDLSSDIRGRFQHGRGGPGGWWIVPDVDVALGWGPGRRKGAEGRRPPVAGGRSRASSSG